MKELYLEAAHQNADMIDPDLQTGLGVLFHLSGEFNRAIDAFNAALTVRPEVRKLNPARDHKFLCSFTGYPLYMSSRLYHPPTALRV